MSQRPNSRPSVRILGLESVSARVSDFPLELGTSAFTLFKRREVLRRFSYGPKESMIQCFIDNRRLSPGRRRDDGSSRFAVLVLSDRATGATDN